MATKATRSDDDMEAEAALIDAVAKTMIELEGASNSDEVDEAERSFEKNVSAIERKFQKGKPRDATASMLARGQRYRDMVTARISSRKRELRQGRRPRTEERDGRASRRAGSEESMGTGQFVERLADELRSEAEVAGIPWETVLDESELTKASRSRINHGKAGLATLERVRTALARLRERSPVEQSSAHRSPTPRGVERPRWVVVERLQGGLFVGETNTPDVEVAERGYVRLRFCRSIRGNADPADLANRGPSAGVEAGEPTASVLVVGVANVYDCSVVAAQAFAAP